MNELLITTLSGNYSRQSESIFKNGVFEYTVPAGTKTSSAGVYKENILVRTLWSGKQEQPGKKKGSWDGLKDDFTKAEDFGEYDVIVQYENVTAKVAGIVGNTSRSFTNGKHWTGFGEYQAPVFAKGKYFTGQFFAEGGNQNAYFTANDIQTLERVNTPLQAIVLANFTDGEKVYWCCANQYVPQLQNIPNYQSNFVFATDAETCNTYLFQYGEQHQAGRGSNILPTDNVLLYNEAGTQGNGSYDKGTAQRNGKFFFVKGADKIFVLDKITGETVNVISIAGVNDLAADNGNQLFAKIDSSIKSFSVDQIDGSLTPVTFSIDNVGNNIGLRIDPSTNHVVIGDSATNDLKFYDSSTGTLLSTFGKTGGFNSNGCAVENDKWTFVDPQQYAGNPSFDFEPDGKFWVRCGGTNRYIHFNADRSFKELITYLPATRSCNVCLGDPSKVFGGLIEYQVDSAKSLESNETGSWKMLNNWSTGLENADGYTKFNGVAKFPNGEIYATVRLNTNEWKLVILSPGDKANIVMNNFTNKIIQADGSYIHTYWDGQSHIITEKATLLRFEDDGLTPVFSSPIQILSTPLPSFSTAAGGIGNIRGAATNTKNSVFFNPGPIAGFVGNHMAVQQFNTDFISKEFMPSTQFDYIGNYPMDNYWDNGNNTGGVPPQHSENSIAWVDGKNIINQAYCEFWRGGEVNIFKFFTDNGLFVTSWGSTSGGTLGWNGNGWSFSLSRIGNAYRIYQPAESYPNGLTAWDIENLDSITEEKVKFNISTAIILKDDVGNLMSGVPPKTLDWTGNSIWNISGDTSIIKTNIFSNANDSPDVMIGTNGNATLRASLNTVGKKSYILSGSVIPQISTAENINYNYMELLDSSEKIIARLNFKADTSKGYLTQIDVNSIVLDVVDVNKFLTQVGDDYKNFSFTFDNGKLLFALSNYSPVVIRPYDQTADITAVKFLQFKVAGPADNKVTVKSLRLIS